ncbi:MAG: AMP-binding protein [Pseudomonadota bacterium]
MFDGAGGEQRPVAAGHSVIADRPAALALAQAFAAGLFRIGGGMVPPVPGDGPMFETLTSGSSAAPRRIRRSHASWLASFGVNAGLFGIGPGAQVAVLGGLVQSLALYAAVEAVHLGACLHLLGDLRPDRQAAALRLRGAEVLYATPAQLRLLVQAAPAPCPALRVIVVGGSKLDSALATALAPLAPSARVVEFYGAAEASFITLADAATPAGSVGRPYPGVEVDLRAGEIWVRSPYLFHGYAGDDPGGAVWQDGWLSVGEMGRMQAGYLHLSGRAGRMVTVADQNVFPEEIETFLAGLPGVAQVAVLPRPDALRGTVLVAVVCGDPGCEDTILAAARARFGPVKAPRALVWCRDWPVLPSGKTDLRALAQAVR